MLPPPSIIPLPGCTIPDCSSPNVFGFPDEATVTLQFKLLAGNIESVDFITYCGSSPCNPSVVRVTHDGNINVVLSSDLHYDQTKNSTKFTKNFPAPEDEIPVQCIKD